MRKQLDEDLRHGRQSRDQQAIADVLVWLMYGFKHGRQLVFWVMAASPAGAATAFVFAVPGTGKLLHRYSRHEKLILAYIHFWPGTIFPLKIDAF
jgi:hypothetical protein